MYYKVRMEKEEKGGAVMTAENGKDKAGVREMDELFRRTDFAAEHTSLSERLQEKIRERLAAQGQTAIRRMLADERELSGDELSEMAAAGSPGAQAVETVRRTLRRN